MTKQTICYFAGIVDGEGCMCISKGSNTYNYRFLLSIMNTSADLMTWLLKNIGGKVYTRKSYSDIWKTRYEWLMTPNTNTEELLLAIKPYIVIKRLQLLNAMKFRSTFKDKHPKRNEMKKLLIEREQYYKVMKELNQKGKIKV